MGFVTFAEKFGFEKGERKGFREGLIQGRRQAVEVAIELRFPHALPSLKTRLIWINDSARLQWVLQIAMTASLAEIEAAIPEHSSYTVRPRQPISPSDPPDLCPPA